MSLVDRRVLGRFTGATAGLLLFGLVLAPACEDATVPPPSSVPEVVAARATLPDRTWQGTIEANLAASEYRIRRAADGGDWRAVNRAQGLVAHFGLRGATLTAQAAASWEVSLSVRGFGRESGLLGVRAADFAEGACLAEGALGLDGACLRRLVAERGPVTEWWENRTAGLEHGFDVTERPDGNGPLVLDLAVTGAEVTVRDGEARFAVADGGELRYAALAAWDAGGHALPASMARTPGGLRLVVDDAGARYPVTIDPLLTTAAWAVAGSQPSQALGCSVASAGDMNGDGFGDLIVGARLYDNGENDEGLAMIFLGARTGPALTPAMSWETNQPGAEFGSSVASAGDVNGDGLGDVIVGARLYDSTLLNEGAAFVFLGQSVGVTTMSSIGWVSNQVGSELGGAVASAGDVNGDGFSDVLVAARRYDSPEQDEGVVFMFLGTPTGSSPTSGANWEGNQVEAQFGAAIASAGDVNADGLGDFVVGAPFAERGEIDEGRIYLYRGSATPGLPAVLDGAREVDQASAQFGASVAGAGDVDGDGFADVLVGAPHFDNAFVDEGRAFLYRGSPLGLELAPAWTAYGDQDGAQFGVALNSAGDVNGDGFADVVVGAPFFDSGETSGETDEGVMYLYRGGPGGLEGAASWSAESNEALALLGDAVASAGDVNGDGFADLLGGASKDDAGFVVDAGRVNLYLGAGSAPGGAAELLDGSIADAQLGRSVASAGDVNGDGFGDALVGIDQFCAGEGTPGCVWLYLGSGSGAGGIPRVIESPRRAMAVGDRFGRAVASAGDVNGDGFGDVIVGAPECEVGAAVGGCAYVYLGSAAGLALEPVWEIVGAVERGSLGLAVASAGDVNGDGFGDLLVGAPGFESGPTVQGRASVYLGRSDFSTATAGTASWTATGIQPDDEFGFSVAGLGDVNGDGYGDIVVGAGFHDGNGGGSGDHHGKVYGYFGNAAFSTATASAVAWSRVETQGGAQYGRAVGAAGDFNGDGFADLVVGAPLDNAAGLDRGRAYLYAGAPSGLGLSASWTGSGLCDEDQFGASVGSAGDVNGDGFGDLVVGAPQVNGLFSLPCTNGGRVAVFLGSAPGVPGLAGPAWTIEGDQRGAELGASVGSGGDFNGDGFGDVVAGAPRFMVGGAPDAGRALIQLGNSAEGFTRSTNYGMVARRPGGGAPLAPGSRAPAAGFEVALRVHTHVGRTRVKLAVEVKPFGTPFDGSRLTVSSTFEDTPIPGLLHALLVTGLAPETRYHFRARVLLAPTRASPQGWSRWLYGGLAGDPAGTHIVSACVNDTDGDGQCSSQDLDDDGDGELDVTDCDDLRSDVHAGGTEVPDDGVDQDCSGFDSVICAIDSDSDLARGSMLTTDLDGSCADDPGQVAPTAPIDCDDGNAAIHPGATEVVDDAIDQDCSGSDSVTCGADTDGDTFRGSMLVVDTDGDCTNDVGQVSVIGSVDCNDANAMVYPGAAEVPDDAVDQDCSGADSVLCGVDLDGDLYRTATLVSDADGACSDADPGQVAPTAPVDCDDSNDEVHPGAIELCDTLDSDCDDDLVDDFTDVNGDGMPECAQDAGTVPILDAGDDAGDSSDGGAEPASPYGCACRAGGGTGGGPLSVAMLVGAVALLFRQRRRGECRRVIRSSIRSRVVCGLMLGFALIASPTQALAQPAAGPATAAEHLLKCAEYFKQNNHPGALDECSKSHALDPRAEALRGMARSLQEMGRLAEAANRYAEYLATPEAKDRRAVAKVAAALAALDKKLGLVTVSITRDGLTAVVDDVRIGAGKGRHQLRVAPGKHTVFAKGREGQPWFEAVEVVAQQVVFVELPPPGAGQKPVVCDIDADGDGALGTRAIDADGSCTDDGVLQGPAGTGTDCHDDDRNIRPGATERCDGIDSDCDGLATDGETDNDSDALLDCADADDDQDGAADVDDCAPRDRTAHVGAEELPGDGIDQDCNGIDAVLCGVDGDGDGHRHATATAVGVSGVCEGVPGRTPLTLPVDCDDTRADVRRGRVDLPGDGVDQDCSGSDGVVTVRSTGRLGLAYRLDLDVGAVSAGPVNAVGASYRVVDRLDVGAIALIGENFGAEVLGRYAITSGRVRPTVTLAAPMFFGASVGLGARGSVGLAMPLSEGRVTVGLDAGVAYFPSAPMGLASTAFVATLGVIVAPWR